MKKSITITVTIALILIATTTYFLNSNYSIQVVTTWVIPCIIASIFVFTIAIRKIPWFKFYFISKYNVLTSKIKYQQEFDFSKKILFEKLIEVIPQAKFKIIEINENTGDIFATSRLSWLSWGENIYINLKEINNKTTVDFYSVCFFQIDSWGKNERNYENLLHEFEESLTI